MFYGREKELKQLNKLYNIKENYISYTRYVL